jgi:hypothetical protein
VPGVHGIERAAEHAHALGSLGHRGSVRGDVGSPFDHTAETQRA